MRSGRVSQPIKGTLGRLQYDIREARTEGREESTARHGKARQGMARQGKARQGQGAHV